MTLPRSLAALAALFLLAGSATVAGAAAPVGKSYPTGRLLVGGQAVPAAKILDARAIPDMAGKPALMVTLDPATAVAVAGAAKEARVAVTLDGRTLGESPRDLLAGEHVLQLSGAFGDMAASAALAQRISGRDPVPDSEGDE